MIKIIIFWVGVDVLGFPLFHKHVLKFSEKIYKVGYDPQSNEGSFSVGASYNPQTGERKIIQRKHLDNEKY